MKTIAQIIHQNKFPLIIRDENGNQLYNEKKDGFWYKRKFNSKGIRCYFEHSAGYVIDHRT